MWKQNVETKNICCMKWWQNQQLTSTLRLLDYTFFIA